MSQEQKVKAYINWIDRLIKDEKTNPVCTEGEIKERIRAFELAKRGITEVWFSDLFEEVAA